MLIFRGQQTYSNVHIWCHKHDATPLCCILDCIGAANGVVTCSDRKQTAPIRAATVYSVYSINCHCS